MVSVASSIHPGAGNMYMCIKHARLWIIVSQLLCGWVQCTPSASPRDNLSQPFLCKACSGDGGRRCPAPLRSHLRTVQANAPATKQATVGTLRVKIFASH